MGRRTMIRIGEAHGAGVRARAAVYLTNFRNSLANPLPDLPVR